MKAMPPNSDQKAVELWNSANADPSRIHKDGIIPLVLCACPGFRSRWENHVAYWNGEPAGIYNDMQEFVAYLIETFKHGGTDSVRAALDVLERLLVEGDSDTKEVATIGFIESLQNMSSWESFGAEAFVPYLNPHSLEAWKRVNEMWRGKSSLVDVIRAENAEGSEPK